MREVTEKLIGEMDDVMEKLFKSSFTFDYTTSMSQDEFETLKLVRDMYSTSCEFAREQAEIIDKLNRNTEELLRINKELIDMNEELLRRTEK